METVFLKILNMSLTASWIIIAVILLRLIFRKSPKYIHCILWGFVGFRLIFPFSIESVISLIPSAEPVPTDIIFSEAPAIQSGIPVVNNVINPIISDNLTAADINPIQQITFIAVILWLTGTAAILLYALFGYIKLYRKVSASIQIYDNIYICDYIETPFILGIIRPHIYMPASIAESQIAHVTAHENAHIKHRDHWWKPLAFTLLCLHWFNPLVWAAYILFCRDIELACDEYVIKEMNIQDKKAYSEALLSFSTARRINTVCPLAFGEIGVKSRIKSILNYKKSTTWIIAVSIIACIVIAVTLLTNPISNTTNSINPQLNSFISNVIMRQHKSSNTENYFACENHKILKVKHGKNITTIYAWVLYMEYEYKNSKLEEISASHIPTVITVNTDRDGYYSLSEYWTPRDGSYYDDDITQKFPLSLRLTALNSQKHIKEQSQICELLAKQYFQILSEDEEELLMNLTDTNNNSIENYMPEPIIYKSNSAYVGYSDNKQIYSNSLNADKIDINSVKHLPIYKFDTKEDLDKFKNDFREVFSMAATHDKIPSFESITAQYDEAFFKNNTVFVVYVSAGSSSYRFRTYSMQINGNSLSFEIKQTSPETGDAAMAGWFVTITVDKQAVAHCTEFDAVLNK